MNATRNLMVSLAILSLLLAGSGFAHAQAGDVEFFAETGHSVRGNFLAYYRSAADPKLLYGYPITEQFVSRDGITVQYFQRARFELVVDASGSPIVRLTDIGAALYKPSTPLDAKNPAACEIVGGFPVCYAFLDFFKANGGERQFGKPVSNAGEQAGTFVQYFERARFDWRAAGFQSHVTIADLGRIYFDWSGENAAHLAPASPPDNSIAPILSLRAQAFVSKSIVRAAGEQTIFVIVRSQTGQPIPGATITATLLLPNGVTQSMQFATDQLGVAKQTITFQNQTAGDRIPIEIKVAFGNLTAFTRTSFRIWF